MIKKKGLMHALILVANGNKHQNVAFSNILYFLDFFLHQIKLTPIPDTYHRN